MCPIFVGSLNNFGSSDGDMGFMPNSLKKSWMVSIGGGGSGSTFGIDGSYYHGAGGSGYIESLYIDISSAEYYLVKVGDQGQNSFVENENGDTLLTANYGFDNLYDNGGHGYSGGGSK